MGDYTEGSEEFYRRLGLRRQSDCTVPPRFLAAEKGDAAKAAARWSRHLEWRSAYHVDGILDEPQTHFRVIKSAYPHAFHERTRGVLTVCSLVCFFPLLPQPLLNRARGRALSVAWTDKLGCAGCRGSGPWWVDSALRLHSRVPLASSWCGAMRREKKNPQIQFLYLFLIFFFFNLSSMNRHFTRPTSPTFARTHF